MKHLLMAVLAVVLAVAFSTPSFAEGKKDKKDEKKGGKLVQMMDADDKKKEEKKKGK